MQQNVKWDFVFYLFSAMVQEKKLSTKGSTYSCLISKSYQLWFDNLHFLTGLLENYQGGDSVLPPPSPSLVNVRRKLRARTMVL